MKFVFWQNMISPHQSFLIKELANHHEVILAVEIISENWRLEQGWKLPDMGNIRIIELIDENTSEKLIEDTKGYIHLFSGIVRYKSLVKPFKKVLGKEIVGVISEAPIQMGFKTIFRRILYKYLSIKYGHKINHIFAIGEIGVQWFQRSGFNQKIIHQFQYTVEIPSDIQNKICDSYSERPMITNFIFIGQITERKGVDKLIISLSKLTDLDWRLHVIGNGPYMEVINKLIGLSGLSERVMILGSMANNEAMQYLLENGDYLVLPSRFDGWGAVINEALLRGVKVVTNNKCGASCIVINDKMGEVYKESEDKGLQNALRRALLSKKESLKSKLELSSNYIKWNSTNLVRAFEAKFSN